MKHDELFKNIGLNRVAKELKNETKLKTLKDIEGFMFNPKEKIVGLVETKKLKQEAIKRVKNCNNPVNFTRSDRCGTNKEYCDVCKREIWFNNLTEKDLK